MIRKTSTLHFELSPSSVYPQQDNLAAAKLLDSIWRGLDWEFAISDHLEH